MLETKRVQFLTHSVVSLIAALVVKIAAALTQRLVGVAQWKNVGL